MATDDAWHRYGRWRRSRPFWGGLMLLLAGLSLFFSANLTLADMKVHFGQEGYLSYLLPIILLLCGALIWVTPAQRLFYAVIGLVTALYSLIGLNLGGFGLGMILGIVGGALAIAWTPATAPPPSIATDTAPESSSGESSSGESSSGESSSGEAPAPPPFAPPGTDGPSADILPGLSRDRGKPRKLLIITLVPLVVTAGMLAVARPTPAGAEPDCPNGLPSRSASATRPARTEEPARTRAPAATSPAPATSPASEKPTPAPSGSGRGDPLVDGWNDFWEGVGELFGAGGGTSPAPSASPSGSSAPSPAPSASSPRKPKPTPSAGLADVPCLGPRVVKVAAPDDMPPASAAGGLLEGDSLTMYDSTYDGVVDVPTATGAVKALKFSMRKSVTKPFSLTIPERGGRTTLIKSNALTTEGNVRFYTPRFTGKLFGLIPVTYTPEQPPPLTLPVLSFTDVKIQLAFVRCDTLTADPLDLSEKA